MIERLSELAGPGLVPLYRPVTLPDGGAQVYSWSIDRGGIRQANRIRRLVCTVNEPMQAPDLMRPLRGVLDLHPILVQTLDQIQPLLQDPPGEGSTTVVTIVFPQTVVMVEVTRRIPVMVSSDLARMESALRRPDREEARLDGLLATDDRDCVPWLYSAMYNLGHPVGPGQEPALRLFLLLLMLRRFSGSRVQRIYPMGQKTGALRRGSRRTVAERLARWLQKESESWYRFTGQSVSLPLGSAEVLRGWLGDHAGVLARLLEEYDCLTVRRRSLESLARAVSSRQQVASCFSGEVPWPASSGRSGLSPVIVPFDRVGPFGLVLSVQEQLQAARFARDQRPDRGQRKRRQSRRMEQPDFFGDLLDYGRDPKSDKDGRIAERLLHQRLRIQTLLPESRELGLLFLQAVLWDWMMATGDGWPGPAAWGQAIPPAEITPGPTFL